MSKSKNRGMPLTPVTNTAQLQQDLESVTTKTAVDHTFPGNDNAGAVAKPEEIIKVEDMEQQPDAEGVNPDGTRKVESGNATETNGTPKPTETKAARFKRLANHRVPAALKRIQHVANLSGRAQYEYTPEQAARIVVSLREAVADLERKFSGVKASEVWSL